MSPHTQPSPRDGFGRAWLWLAALCGVGVIAFYAWRSSGAVSELGPVGPGNAYYNLQVDGFRRGQLSLSLSAPAELQRLPDPYDPAANAPFRKFSFAEGRLHDLSYYDGKLYLYFSPVPALLVFWPYHTVTGRYLDHASAVAIFASLGFLVSAALLFGVWRQIGRAHV